MSSTLNVPAGTDPKVRHAAIVATLAKSGRYNFAARAGLAHELWLDLDPKSGKIKRGSAAALATATGFDAGELSRMAFILSNDKVARAAAGKFDVLSLDGIDSDEATFTAAEKIGSKFTRTAYDKIKQATTAGTPAKVKAEKTAADPLADVMEWALAADSDEAYLARKSAIENMLANIDAERADRAAKQASEALEVAQIEATA